MSSRNPQDRHRAQDSKKCITCGKFNIRLWFAGSAGYCEKCLMRAHEKQKRQEDQQEADRQRQHKRQQQAARLQHEREEAERQRQDAEQQRVHELEIEKVKKDQEEIKLKQEKIKAKANEVQRAQQIEFERIKLQQEQEKAKAQKQEINLQLSREETKRESTAFERERNRSDLIEILAGCTDQTLKLIWQITQDERIPINRLKQSLATAQNRSDATIQMKKNRTGPI